MTTDASNKSLWSQLESTPPQHTKHFRRAGGFSGTAIDPTYRLQRLTEVFGPVGQGWRFVVEKMWREDFGSPVVFVTGYLWYRVDGKKYRTSSHTGGTVADRTPDECYKMAESDACGKACLDLGLAADVYLGQHDGDKYDKQTQSQQPAPQSQMADDRPWFNDFEKRQKQMLDAVRTGKRTPQQIVENLEKDYRLNQKTRKSILDLGKNGVA